MISSPPTKLANIQALRGLAALAVVLLHLTGTQKLGGILNNQGWAAHGWAGVHLFFIISGFIMVWVTRDISSGVATAWKFLVARAARIYPLWWACVLIVGALYMLIHGVPASLSTVAREDAWSHFTQSFFLMPHQYELSVAPGWSLIHELYFYVVFAFILMLGLRRRLLAALAVWVAVTLVGLALNWDEASSPFAEYIISEFTLLFIAGALIGLWVSGRERLKFGWICVALAVITLLALMATDIINREHQIAQLTIPLSLLVYGVVAIEFETGAVMPRPFIWLGDISYSLYLTHALVFLAWQILHPLYPGGLLFGMVDQWPRALLIAVDMALLIVASLITAQIFYVCVEKPSLWVLRRYLPAYRRHSPQSDIQAQNA